jgi:hypothetical protein
MGMRGTGTGNGRRNLSATDATTECAGDCHVGHDDMGNLGVDAQFRRLRVGEEPEAVAEPDAYRSVDDVADHVALQFRKTGLGSGNGERRGDDPHRFCRQDLCPCSL